MSQQAKDRKFNDANSGRQEKLLESRIQSVKAASEFNPAAATTPSQNSRIYKQDRSHEGPLVVNSIDVKSVPKSPANIIDDDEAPGEQTNLRYQASVGNNSQASKISVD